MTSLSSVALKLNTMVKRQCIFDRCAISTRLLFHASCGAVPL